MELINYDFANNTMFGLMKEIVRLTFLEDRYVPVTFAMRNGIIGEVLSAALLKDDMTAETQNYSAKFISGADYDVDYNVMLIRIPTDSSELLNTCSYKSFWKDGKKVLVFAIPEDISMIKLDELMLLYFKHFASISKYNTPFSKLETSTIIVMVYSFLLEMIEMGIGIKECGAETIHKVIPAQILLNNGFDTTPLGEETSKLIFKHAENLQLSEEFMVEVVNRLKDTHGLSSALRGTLYKAYAFELERAAMELEAKEGEKDGAPEGSAENN